MQPINIYDSQNVKVTIDENGTPVQVTIAGCPMYIEFYADYASLPNPGQGGILYITEDTNYLYRWDGSYVQVGGGSLTWGQITGTLSNQTDLQTALDDKVPYTGATQNIDIGTNWITANDGTNDSAFAPDFIGVENSSNQYSEMTPTSVFSYDNGSVTELTGQGITFPDNSVQTTAGISSVSWGDIQGTLSNQTDIQSALDGKVDENAAITGDTKTKITYDSKGLVTSGADAGISDITGLQTALDGKVDENSPITGATKTKITYDSKGLVTSGTDAGISDISGLQTALDGKFDDPTGTTSQYIRGDGSIASFPSIPGGTVTSVGLSMPSGFSVSNSPITSSGSLTVTGSGTSADYIDGTGAIQTFPTLTSADKMVTVGRNSTGSTLYKGTVVYILGSTGNRPNFVKAQANSEATSAGTFGVVYADISNNADGQVVTIGTIDSLDTRTTATHPFTSDTLSDGDTIYLSPNTAGYITNVKPSAPNHLVYVGKVVRTSPTNGTIVYRIQNGYELEELHNVAINSGTLSNGQVLKYNSTTQLWENNTDAAGTGTVTSIATSSPLTGGTITTSGTIGITQATTTTSGYLSSTDWNTFNGKQNALTNPVTGTGTTNELTYFSGTSAVSSLSTATYPSLTELSYVKGVTSSIQTQLNGKQATLTNPITGTGTSGQIGYFNGTTSLTGSATLTYTPTTALLVNNSVTASGAIARGTNLTPTLTAAANSDVLVGLDIAPTFTNGAFTGVSNYGLRTNSPIQINYQNTASYSSTGPVPSLHIMNDNTGGNSNQYASIRLQQRGSTGTSYALSNIISLQESSNTGASLIFNSRNSAGTQTDLFRIYSNGNVVIQNGGTFTDSGYKLDVNGTARMQGAFTLSNIYSQTSDSITSGNLFSITQTRNNTNGNVLTVPFSISVSRSAGTSGNGGNVMSLSYTGEAVGSGNVLNITHSAGNESAINISSTTSNSTAALNITKSNIGGTIFQGSISSADTTSTANGIRIQRIGATISNGTKSNLIEGLSQTTATTRTIGRITTVLENNTDASFAGGLIFSTATAGALSEVTRIFGSGNLLIQTGGTFTDLGYKLDVNGTARIQNKLSVGTPSATSAVLEVTSTTQGFLPPRMTTTQRDAISTPATGLIIFNTTTTKLETYDGATWQAAW